jgi:hypothetical protein
MPTTTSEPKATPTPTATLEPTATSTPTATSEATGGGGGASGGGASGGGASGGGASGGDGGVSGGGGGARSSGSAGTLGGQAASSGVAPVTFVSGGGDAPLQADQAAVTSSSQAATPVAGAPETPPSADAPETPGVSVLGIRTLGPSNRVTIAPEGGNIPLSSTASLAVPSAALRGRSVIVDFMPAAPDSAGPPPASGFSFGSWSTEIEVRDALTGDVLPKLAVPLQLTYQLEPNEQGQLDNARLHLASWQAGSWQALPCSSPTPHTLNCTMTHPGLVAVLLVPPAPDVQDWPIPGGHFYQQANGFGGAAGLGYAVIDDAEAAFWTELQRLGDVHQLGYPITARFQHNGFPTQVFQKVALQWRADLNQAVPLNIYDDLNQLAADSWLDSTRQVPPAADTSADTGLSFEEIVSRHVALLDDSPPLAEFYAADPDAMQTFGLPLALKRYGPLVAVRLQRAVLQLWTIDTPFAAAGTVVVDNAADVAKEIGLWPTHATAASTSPQAEATPSAAALIEPTRAD